MTEQPSRYPRTFSGLLGSIVVLLVLVLGVVGFQALKQSNPADPVVPVDYLAAASYAEGEATFTLAVPRTLPEGWIATSATFTPGADQSWHLGLLTKDRHYVGVEQAFASAKTMVQAHVDQNAVRGDDVKIGLFTWQMWTDSGGDTALVIESSKVTTLVVGTVDVDVLAALVETLPVTSFVDVKAL